MPDKSLLHMLPRTLLRANPIIVKELRSRMRGWRAFAVLTGALVLMGGISYLLYRIVLAATQYDSTPVSPQIGQAVFVGLMVVELMIVCFITPAVTAGSISGEREKLTYEMLLATPLRPASVLWGKLISALSYVFLLILAGIPMASLVFIFGGVALVDMVKSLVVLLATTVTLGVIGVFMSALLRRTVTATVLSYLSVLALLIGPLLVYIFVGVLRQAEPPRWILIPNPVSALFSALAPSTPQGGGFLNQLSWVLSGALGMLDGRSMSSARIPRPLYHYTLPLYGLISLVFYAWATRLVRTTRRWRIRWREALIGLACLVALLGVVAIPFLLTAGRYERVSIFRAPTPMPRIEPVIVERKVEVVVVEEREVPPPVPTPTPAPPGAQPERAQDLSEEAQIEIYAAVIRQLYTVDHTFGRAPEWPVVYVLGVTDDRIGDPDAPQSDPAPLPEVLRSAIVEGLQDLPAEFIWVEMQEDVPLDNRGSVADGGAMVTLGNVHLNEHGQALVSARVFFAMLGAGAQTYVLEQIDGAWQIVGTTGVQIVS